MERLRIAVIAVLAFAAPRAALACPVCFGQSDAPMAVATNAGIWLMLGVVFVMLSAFAFFFIYLSRRMKRLARLAESEGTASC